MLASVHSERERGQSRRAIDEHHGGIKIGGDDEIRGERADEIRSRVVDVDQIRDFVLDQVASVDGVRGDDRVQRLTRSTTKSTPNPSPRNATTYPSFLFFFFWHRTEESRDAIDLS